VAWGAARLATDPPGAVALQRMTLALGLLMMLPVYVGLGYLIYIDYRARNTFTPGEAAIFKEMRRVLEADK
jgi:hypothetical protein